MAYTEYAKQSENAKKLRKQAGLYIQGLRKDAGLTQNELAKRLGLDYYTFISQVENGFNRVPPESMSEWARALKVDQQEFAKKLLSFYDPHMYQALFGKTKS